MGMDDILPLGHRDSFTYLLLVIAALIFACTFGMLSVSSILITQAGNHGPRLSLIFPYHWISSQRATSLFASFWVFIQKQLRFVRNLVRTRPLDPFPALFSYIHRLTTPKEIIHHADPQSEQALE